jgi:hypothetical protein
VQVKKIGGERPFERKPRFLQRNLGHRDLRR